MAPAEAAATLGQMSIAHKGKVEGDSITGTADAGEMGTIPWTAKRKE